MKRIQFLAICVSGLLGVGSQAAAETRRIAIVVGNNAGSGGRPALHFAEVDAGKIARVLLELGRVNPDDMFLLQGRSLSALQEVVHRAKERADAYHRQPDTRVVLIFYFSGHSDGETLELGRDRLAFSQLRRWLSESGANVRVGIVDSCKSGALLSMKAGKPGPNFEIRLVDDLASSGEALLTSSAADEVALESREIGGSFFTHHFVSGLRGAADSSGDGLVTLGEAYQYAFAHTVSTTSGTLAGAQHPVYDYRLAGQGELILSELLPSTATLQPPAGFERTLIVQLLRDQVIAELASGAAAQIAVPPGTYGVRSWKDGVPFAGRFNVTDGEKRVIRAEELEAVPNLPSAKKGGTSIASSTEDKGEDWNRSFPPLALRTYFQNIAPTVIAARSDANSTAARAAGDALEAQLRSMGASVMQPDAKISLSGLDDSTIVKRVGPLGVDAVLVLRLFPDATGQVSIAVVSIYDKTGQLSGAFTAERGIPIQEKPRALRVGQGVSPQAEESVSKTLDHGSPSRKNASEEYDLHYIGFTDVTVFTLSGAGATSTREWSVPYEGKYKKPLEGVAFYRKVGRADLVAAYESKNKVRTGLKVAGVSSIVAGAIVTIVTLASGSDDCGSASSPGFSACVDRNIQKGSDRTVKFAIGAGLVGAGVGLLTWGIVLNPHPIDGSQARQIAEEYNQKLRSDLRMAEEPAAPRSPEVKIAIQPVISRSGGGLVLGLSF